MRGWIWIASALAVVVASALLIAVDRPAPTGASPGYGVTAVLPVPAPLPPFRLADQHGRVFGLAELYRHWSFIYALPSPCGEACGAQLGMLSTALERWVETSGFTNTQVVLLPVSPHPDPPGIAPAGDRRFLALAGDAGQQETLRQQLFGREAAPGTLALVDPLGRLLARSRPPYEEMALDRDYRRIREQYGAECCVGGDDEPEIVLIRGANQPPAVVRVK